MNLLGSTVGLAFVGTMCSFRNSVGLTQDGGRGSVVGVASTAAHELGHIFNMQHDDGRKLGGGSQGNTTTATMLFTHCCIIAVIVVFVSFNKN